MTSASRRAAKDALFDGFATVARALASGRRVEIIELLTQGERTVEDIAREIGQSVANTSHHLRTLAKVGLVSTRRDGTHVRYRVASDDVVDMWLAMRGVAAEHLDSLDGLAQDYLGERDEIQVIDRDEVEDRLRTGEVVLIDVRPHAEYASGHIRGAIPIAPGDWQTLDEFVGAVPLGREIVAYCRGPYCVYADDAVRYLAGRGVRARRLDGGAVEWCRDGRPLDT
jgi:rhodanese-related sulfurtransferase/DNA-binding HxlR family transcriptional regulator